MRRIPFFWLLIFQLSVLVLMAGGRLAPRDEETTYRMTANLIERGQLTITQQPFTVEPQAFSGFLPHATPRTQDTTWTGIAPSGQRYPLYSHAQPILQIPFYLLGRVLGGAPIDLSSVAITRFTVSLLNPIVIALTGWLIAVFAVQLNYSTRLSVGLACIYCFATMALAYSHTNFSDPLLALLFLLAAYSAFRARTDHRVRWSVVAGLALGSALYLRERSLIVLPIFVGYVILTGSLRSVRHWIAFLVPMGCAAILIGLWSWVRFGTPLAIGYANWVEDTGFATPMLLGMYGLLISPGKGLLVYNPIVLLGFIGLSLLLRRRRAEAILFMLIVIVSIVFYASYNFWTGGWNWGPRYMLPLLPFLLLAAGEWVSVNPSRFRRGMLIGLSVLTFLINLPAMLVDQSRYLVGFGERDPDRYLARSILFLQDSPVAQQWPIVFEMASMAARSETWRAAQQAIDDHLQSYQGNADVESLSTHLMWVDEFFRLNVPDFWFVHWIMLGVSPAPVALVIAGLIGLAVVSGRQVFQGMRAEG